MSHSKESHWKGTMFLGTLYSYNDCNWESDKKTARVQQDVVYAWHFYHHMGVHGSKKLYLHQHVMAEVRYKALYTITQLHMDIEATRKNK